MKIAFIGQKGIPSNIGGVEKHVEEVATQLVRLGHEVTVYTRPNYVDKNLTDFKGIRLVSLKSVGTKHLDAITHTFRAIIDASKKDFDVVHFHSIGPSSLIWIYKIFNPFTPVIGTFHSRDYFHRKWSLPAKMFLKFGEWSLCNFSDVVITVSKELAEYVSKKYKIIPQYFPNGINKTENIQADIIKSLGLENKNYILNVGRLIKHKGLHYLLEAYKKLDTDKKLVIVGEGFFTDKYVNKLEKMSKDNPNIIFTGKKVGRELGELFSNAYLFVQPSESEGLSIALIEAMSYSIPVLVSDIPENKEVIADCGFTFSSKNVNDLASKLNELLEKENTIKLVGLNGKKNIEDKYLWENIVGDMESAYMSVCINKDKYIKRKFKFANKIVNLFI